MSRAPHLTRRNGFTLIELMIVVAVVALLATVALPSFLDQVRKSRRADAISALSQIQQAQERWRANNPQYSNDLAGIGVSNPSSGYYTLALPSASATGYTATATAAGAQASDSRCTALSITVSGGSTTYGATGSWSATPNRCWNR
jgi:type IV pilus assembly protein PilE